jgi:parvulin-like peptidyl-prolyl isomerase
LAEQRVKVDEKLVADHVKQIEQRLASSGRSLPDFLNRLGITEEQMRADIRNDYRWVAYVESQAKESVLRKYFEANRAAFDGSEIHVKHILVKAPEGVSPDLKELARRTAEDLRAKIKAGQAFEDVCKYSECPSKEKGGELPWFPRKGVMSEPFAAAAFGLKEGELSPVVETEFGYHLIVVLEKRPGKEAKPFEEVKDEVKTWYAEDLRRAEVARLRKKADIQVMF